MSRRCRCGTILNAYNKTGFCLIHQPSPESEPIKGRSLGDAQNERKQWARFLSKIRVEVARAFSTTVINLEEDDFGPPHFAVCLILTALFKVPVSKAVWCMDLRRSPSPSTIEENMHRLYERDAGFRTSYERACEALMFIDTDILPVQVDLASIPLKRDTGDDADYTQARRVIGARKGGLRRIKESDRS